MLTFIYELLLGLQLGYVLTYEGIDFEEAVYTYTS